MKDLVGLIYAMLIVFVFISLMTAAVTFGLFIVPVLFVVIFIAAVFGIIQDKEE